MKKIKLNDGFYATIDSEDYDFLMEFSEIVGAPWKVYKASTNKVAAAANFNLMHRIILRANTGQTVTHINGDGLDNRKQNLN